MSDKIGFSQITFSLTIAMLFYIIQTSNMLLRINWHRQEMLLHLSNECPVRVV